MAELLHNQPRPSEEPSQEKNDASASSNTGSRIAAGFAAGAFVAAGAGYEAPAVIASPATHGEPAHTQDVGSQKVTDGKFLQTGRVSAETLLGMRANTAKSAEKAKNPAAEFMTKFFDQIATNTASSYEGVKGKNGNPPLMAFNGVAEVSSDARWYTYIDPTLGKGYKAPQFGYEIGLPWHGKYPDRYKNDMAASGMHEWGPGKKIRLEDPVFKYDGHRWWVGVSNLSSPFYKGRGVLDANHMVQPVDQATEPNEWVWTVYYPNTVNLYEYTTKADTPKVQPFFPLNAVIVPQGTDQSYYTNHGLFNNFVPANNWKRPSSKIAAWQDQHYIGATDNGTSKYALTDGGKFISAKRSKQELTWMSTKSYKLPSNPKSVVSTMQKCSVTAGYTGND